MLLLNSVQFLNWWEVSVFWERLGLFFVLSLITEKLQEMLIYQDAYLGIKIVPCCYLSLFFVLRSLVLFSTSQKLFVFECCVPFSTSAAVERGELCSYFTCWQHGALRAPVCSEWPSFGRLKLREVCLGESINSWSGTGIGSSISRLSWMLWDVVCKLCNSLKWEDELKGCGLQSFKSVQLQT